MGFNKVTCPGKTPETGVEPPEWLGEFGRDLQEATRAACFFAVIIFWAAVEQNLSKKLQITIIYVHLMQRHPLRLVNTPSVKTRLTLSPYVAQVS